MARSALGSAVALGLCLASLDAFAQARPSPDVAAAAGGYLLSTEKGARRCMILLRTVAVERGHAIGFPAHCRLALPVLVNAAAWTVERTNGPPHGRIRFLDTEGRIVLDFDRDGPGDAVATAGEAGSEHLLSAGDGRTLAQRYGQAVPPRNRAAPATATGPATSPMVPGDTRLMGATVGAYLLVRGKDRPTGCTLVLSEPLTGAARATVRPGCADHGLQVFATDRWSISDGTLWLMNARGQKLSFERNRQGGWDKSAGQGEPLSLQRVP